jgi:hypothetical protein
MRTCPGCDYLVPPAWADCKRCGASLAGAREAVGVASGQAAAHRAVPKPVTPASSALHFAAFAPSDPSFAAATPVADLRPWESGRSVDALSSAEPRRRRRIPFIGPVAAIALVALVFVGWQRITHLSVPAALGPWVEHHHGIEFAPTGAGFRVSMPAAPLESTAHITVSRGVEGAAPVAVTSISDYEVGATWLGVPRAALAAAGDDPLASAVNIAATAGGFAVQVQTTTRHGRYPAVELEINRDGHDGKALMVLADTRIYVVFIVSPHNVDAGFDYVARSLKIA